jgi:hypothetical protein
MGMLILKDNGKIMQFKKLKNRKLIDFNELASQCVFNDSNWEENKFICNAPDDKWKEHKGLCVIGDCPLCGFDKLFLNDLKKIDHEKYNYWVDKVAHELKESRNTIIRLENNKDLDSLSSFGCNLAIQHYEWRRNETIK